MSHLPAPALPHSRPPLITLVTQPSPYLRPAVTSAGHIFFRPKKTSWQPGLQVSPGLHAPPENQNQIEDAHNYNCTIAVSDPGLCTTYLEHMGSERYLSNKSHLPPRQSTTPKWSSLRPGASRTTLDRKNMSRQNSQSTVRSRPRLFPVTSHQAKQQPRACSRPRRSSWQSPGTSMSRR